MIYKIVLLLLSCASIHPAVFQSERTTMGRTSQDNVTRMREGTKQMHEGLMHAVRPASTPATPRATISEVQRSLIITKMPIHQGPQKY